MSAAGLITLGVGQGGNIKSLILDGLAATNAAAVQPPAPSGHTGGGGQSPGYRKSVGATDFGKVAEIAADLRKRYASIYEAAADVHTPAEDRDVIADAAAEAVSKYAPPKSADLPAPTVIDWEAIAAEGQRVARDIETALKLIEARIIAAARMRARAMLDDEDAAILLLCA